MKKLAIGLSGFFASLISVATHAFDFGFIASNGSVNGVPKYAVVEGNETSTSSIVDIPFSLADERVLGEFVRDGVKLDDGGYVVYDGTFNPVLSVYQKGAWRHLQFDGWNTDFSADHGGGIATDNRYVFVTDMEGSGDSTMGVIRFDLNDIEPTVRFAEDVEPIGLTLGRDGFLYVLYPSLGRDIDVYDVTSLAKIRTVGLPDILGFTNHRAIAVDADGNIYIADSDGDVQKISNAGNVVAQTTISNFFSKDLFDIDLIGDSVVIGNTTGEVLITDESLSMVTTIKIEDLDASLGSNSNVFILGESADLSGLHSILEDGFEDE